MKFKLKSKPNYFIKKLLNRTQIELTEKSNRKNQTQIKIKSNNYKL
jgi:hypothetical protein